MLPPFPSLQGLKITEVQNTCPPPPPTFGDREVSELVRGHSWDCLEVLGVNLGKEALELSLINRAELPSIVNPIVLGLGLRGSAQATTKRVSWCAPDHYRCKRPFWVSHLKNKQNENVSPPQLRGRFESREPIFGRGALS